MCQVSPISPLFFPELESHFQNRLDVIASCIDPEFRQIFYSSDAINVQLRRDLNDPENKDYVLLVQQDDGQPATLLGGTTTDVNGYRYFDFTLNASPYEGAEVCIIVAEVLGGLNLNPIATSWPFLVKAPPDETQCDPYFQVSYTDCGAGPGCQYWGPDGARVYSLRLPLAVGAASWASNMVTFFSSLGPGSVCNSIHEKTIIMGTFEFIPEWLATKLQFAASLNNFSIEGTRYFLNADPIRQQGNGFGLYNFEFSFKLAEQLSKSACCQ